MNPTLIDSMSWAMAEVYGAVTDRIMVNLARYFPYIKDADEVQGSFAYQALMLAQMGKVNRETVGIISQSLDGADDALKRALEAAILDALKNEEPALQRAAKQGLLWASPPNPEFTPNQMQAFQAYYRQSADKLNLVNTVMLESTQEAYRATVADVAKRIQRTQSILNVGAGEVVTGVSTWNQAMRDAVRDMARNGLTGFVDHAGRRWSPEAYAAMDIRSTMFNTARAAVWERAEEYGADIYQVSSHNGARPLCYPWQGKLISRSGWTGEVEDIDGNVAHVYAESETTKGEPAGLFGINCRHYPMPFIPKFSALRYKGQDEEDNERTYEESQEQRRLERKLRGERLELELLKAQGASPEAIQAQREKVRQASTDIDNFCDETGRARKRNREGTPVYATWPDPQTYDPALFPNNERDKMRNWYASNGITNNVVSQATQTTPDVVQFTGGQYKLSELSGDYADMIAQKFNSGDETARKAWEKLIPDGGCVADANTKGTPYHREGKVYLNVQADTTNKRGAGCTFFHENGHALDYYGGWLSDDEKFRDALKADYANALKATGKKTKDDQRFALSMDLSKPDVAHKANGVSDIIDGLSKGKCHGLYGHGEKYWRDRPDTGVQREAFAHMNEAAFLEGQREMTTKYFPTAYKRFIEILGGVK